MIRDGEAPSPETQSQQDEGRLQAKVIGGVVEDYDTKEEQASFHLDDVLIDTRATPSGGEEVLLDDEGKDRTAFHEGFVWPQLSEETHQIDVSTTRQVIGRYTGMWLCPFIRELSLLTGLFVQRQTSSVRAAIPHSGSPKLQPSTLQGATSADDTGAELPRTLILYFHLED